MLINTCVSANNDNMSNEIISDKCKYLLRDILPRDCITGKRYMNLPVLPP